MYSVSPEAEKIKKHITKSIGVNMFWSNYTHTSKSPPKQRLTIESVKA
jgi:hypothetical protein